MFPIINSCSEKPLTLSGPVGGGGLRGPDDKTLSCQSETSYSMIPKLNLVTFSSSSHEGTIHSIPMFTLGIRI